MKTLLLVALCIFAISPTLASDVTVSALFPGKAMLIVNGGKPRLLSAGQLSTEGVKLISADSRQATVEVDGKRRILALGESISTSFAVSGKPTVRLAASSGGHFITGGSINGAAVQFLVDTGATYVAMGVDEARRIGVAYLNGSRGYSSTANGVVETYRVILDTVKIGEITLNNVEGSVLQASMPGVLLGMSFLKRLQMTRENDTMVLVKNY